VLVVVVVLLVVLAVFAVLAVVLPVLAVLPVFAVVLRLSFGGSGGRAGGGGQLSRRSAGRDRGGSSGINDGGCGSVFTDNEVLEAVVVHAGLEVVVRVVTLNKVVLSVGHGESPDNRASGDAGNESDSGLGRHSY